MPATLKINLNSLGNNLKEIRKGLNDNVKCLAMIKANAYGAGAIKVAQYIEEKGLCEYLGVAHVKEAIELREAGITMPIITFTEMLEDQIDNVLEYNLIVAISNSELLIKLDEKARNANKIIKVHIKIDTGMSRLGYNLDDIEIAIQEFKKTTSIEYEGIYTHFACSDTSEDYTNYQVNEFEKALKIFENNGFRFEIVHADNSAGAISYKETNFDMVRIGIIMYGYYPNINLKQEIKLEPTFNLTAPICEIKNIKRGTAVSYGGTFVAKRDTTLAILQIGYADGLSRTLSNKLNVYIKNNPVKIVGNICMDMCMIDITDIKDKIEIGENVRIFESEEELDNIANLLETINYEIISRISPRVERKYITK